MEYFRGNSDRLAQKLFAEYQAKRYAVDIVDGSSTTTMVRRAGFLQRFYSPHLAEYPAELKDAEGFWGVSNLLLSHHRLQYTHGQTQRRSQNLRRSAASALERDR
jgi:ABC-type Fe3+ transport system substrate-binding protein